ncbi:MAG: DUF2085 domain-containing protein [Chloroflexota bacterium]
MLLTFVRRYRPHWRLVEFALFMMMIGPLIAPFFARVNDPMFQAVSRFIFWIGEVICPQPQYAFEYGGRPYAVCYRCLMALVGLIIARWLHRPGGALVNWPLKNRLIALGLSLLWLQIDLQFTAHGIWEASIPLMIVHGIPYGVSVGAVCYAPLVALDRWLDKLQLHQKQQANTAVPSERLAVQR